MIILEYLTAGFVGGVLLLVVSKVIMSGLLQRPTDYYVDRYDQGGNENE